jgi:hypothetical protein
MLGAGFRFMNTNWQLQRETLPRPVFRHGTSSRLAFLQALLGCEFSAGKPYTTAEAGNKGEMYHKA